MFFTYDIVLVAENRWINVDERLENPRATLELKGFRISQSKTEHMHCNFSKTASEEDDHITMEGHFIPYTTKFKYLGSYI